MPNEPDIAQCESIEEHDHQALEGADDGYSIALYRTSNGKHFIHTIHSDMSLKYDGASGFNRWVDTHQVLAGKTSIDQRASPDGVHRSLRSYRRPRPCVPS